jgi:hypothetical protein
MIISILLSCFRFNQTREGKSVSLPTLPLEIITKIFSYFDELDFTKRCLLNKQWKELTSKRIQKWEIDHTIQDLCKEIPAEIKKQLQALSLNKEDRVIVLLTEPYVDEFEMDPSLLCSRTKCPMKVTWLRFNKVGKKADLTAYAIRFLVMN